MRTGQRGHRALLPEATVWAFPSTPPQGSLALDPGPMTGDFCFMMQSSPGMALSAPVWTPAWARPPRGGGWNRKEEGSQSWAPMQLRGHRCCSHTSVKTRPAKCARIIGVFLSLVWTRSLSSQAQCHSTTCWAETPSSPDPPTPPCAPEMMSRLLLLDLEWCHCPG